MNRIFRIIKLIFLVISILLCLAIPVAGLVSTVTGYHGVCHGFTDSQHTCPWWEFAGMEMFWASFLFVPVLFAASIVWLVMSAVQFVMAMMKKRREGASHQNDSKEPLDGKT